MTNTEIENKIIEFVRNSNSFTVFLLKQEFKTRERTKVQIAIENLKNAGKIYIDENFFIKPSKEVDR